MLFVTENERLLRLEQQLLSLAPRLVTPDALNALVASGVGEEVAFALLVAAAFGLEPDRSDADRRFVYDWLVPSVRCLDASRFEGDGYLLAVRFPDAACGDVRFATSAYAPCEAFACGDLSHGADGRLVAPVGFFLSEFRYPIVCQRGREWMTVTPNEIITMQPAVEAARGHVLVYGLGLGYYAFKVSQKTDVLSVTVVERDPDILSLFRTHLLPQFPMRAKLDFVLDDAFRHAENTRFRRPDGSPYDTVFTDLWHDVADGLPLYRRMRCLQQQYAIENQRFLYWIEPSLRCYMSEQQ